MQVVHHLSLDGRWEHLKYSCPIEEPSLCPQCKHAIKPQTLGVFDFQTDSDDYFVSALFLCKSCYRTFVSLYSCEFCGSSQTVATKLIYTEPTRYTPEVFDCQIETISPQFVKIYNQALAAESSGLDEIAGLGYRKAMEFLVKDYCIHTNPEDEVKIKSMPLSQCITTYVKSEQIQTLATRAAWIGNDEAHYVRKQEDRDVSDMKNFIKALVYFIGMVLITEDAAAMSPA